MKVARVLFATMLVTAAYGARFAGCAESDGAGLNAAASATAQV